MNHSDTLKAVLQTSCELTVREWFTRTMRIMGETGDPNKLAIACGFDPDDIVKQGENFSPSIKIVDKP